MTNRQRNSLFLINIIILFMLVGGLGVTLQKYYKQQEELESVTLNREQWKSVLVNSNFALIGINEFGFIELWSDGAVDLFGWHQSEIIGKNIEVLFDSKGKDSHYKGFQDTHLKELLSTGQFISTSGTMINKEGKRISVTVTVKAVQNGHTLYVGTILPKNMVKELTKS